MTYRVMLDHDSLGAFKDPYDALELVEQTMRRAGEYSVYLVASHEGMLVAAHEGAAAIIFLQGAGFASGPAERQTSLPDDRPWS